MKTLRNVFIFRLCGKLILMAFRKTFSRLLIALFRFFWKLISTWINDFANTLLDPTLKKKFWASDGKISKSTTEKFTCFRPGLVQFGPKFGLKQLKRTFPLQTSTFFHGNSKNFLCKEWLGWWVLQKILFEKLRLKNERFCCEKTNKLDKKSK